MPTGAEKAWNIWLQGRSSALRAWRAMPIPPRPLNGDTELQRLRLHVDAELLRVTARLQVLEAMEFTHHRLYGS